jgi:hypothetical protein
MKNILSICTLVLFSHLCLSQDVINNKIEKLNKNISYIEDSRIAELNKTYAAAFELEGYRIQIYSGNKRQPANHARSTFLKKHPKTKAHLGYYQPFYRVRVGDFQTKLEALKYKRKIAAEFPNCYIVTDVIAIKELLD